MVCTVYLLKHGVVELVEFDKGIVLICDGHDVTPIDVETHSSTLALIL